MKFFDEYVLEVTKHMEYENNIVFKYAKLLSNNTLDPNYNIS